MFKKSLVAVAAIASATAAMTTTAQAGWGWIGYQSDSSWAVYDYSGGGWTTVYTQNYVNGLRGQITGLQSMVADKNNLIGTLKAEVAAKSMEITELNGQIEDLQGDLEFANDQVEFLTGARNAAEAALSEAAANLGMAYAELNDADAEVARLTAELAIANAALAAQPEVPGAPAVPDSEEVSALTAEAMETELGQILGASAIEEFVRTGSFVNGTQIVTIEGLAADGHDVEALSQLRDIRVAAVEAGMSHDSYVGLDHAGASTPEYTTRVNSDGSMSNETFVTININGKTFSSAAVNEDGSTTGRLFEVGESAQDWVEGFESGYNAGYDDGYADGFADGYAAGVSDSTN